MVEIPTEAEIRALGWNGHGKSRDNVGGNAMVIAQQICHVSLLLLAILLELREQGDENGP